MKLELTTFNLENLLRSSLRSVGAAEPHLNFQGWDGQQSVLRNIGGQAHPCAFVRMATSCLVPKLNPISKEHFPT
jgi:hypothetical protein